MRILEGQATRLRSAVGDPLTFFAQGFGGASRKAVAH
jgi:hypothetical protein